MTLTIRRATLNDLDALAPLFAAYRCFYSQAPDLALARGFLQARLQRGESVVFLAGLDGAPAGFTQLYPMFSSVRAARVWVLNDLFVDSAARQHGVARALLRAAADFARADGAIRLELETTPDNLAAQTLYEDQGWQQYDGTLRYHLPLATTATA
ncbi:GNAT family N-acetyltransferase [Marilutibacter alkalisoli]|uniref:GNAT family N-acetyltransferase n=1 Tax=Marilutibacter alkalisoli TaxID=2591633 RepID=A0A514BTT3_9GAMM|nr:GNAT family N-acetyltransferase [Lysobacter alkalisoli]QDH70715.1 GNAT family N-acetyltransferase [Lysobacter alkalisoli]